MTKKEEVSHIIMHSKNDINACVAMYLIMKQTDANERGDILQLISKEFQSGTPLPPLMEIPEVISTELLLEYRNKYGEQEDKYLEQLIEKKLSINDFYSELAEHIISSEELQDEGARAYAIFHLCVDRRFPYADIDLDSGLTMTSSEFRQLNEQLRQDGISYRVDYILHGHFRQRTQRASLLLKELEKYNNNENLKTVLFAYIMERLIDDMQELLLPKTE